TISTPSDFDSQLRIYDSAGQALTSVIDETPGGETTTRNLSQGNWYYIAVAGYASATGNYTLNINGPGVPIRNVQAPATINSAIDWNGDVDYFFVTAPALTNKLTLTTTPFSLDTFIEFYDAAGNLLQSADS